MKTHKIQSIGALLAQQPLFHKDKKRSCSLKSTVMSLLKKRLNLSSTQVKRISLTGTRLFVELDSQVAIHSFAMERRSFLIALQAILAEVDPSIRVEEIITI